MPAKFNMLKWFRWSLLSFITVASLGLLMRYKIAYSFPWLNQKSLQMAHANLAFLAWVSHSLWVFIAHTMAKEFTDKTIQKMNAYLAVNLLSIFSLSSALLLLGNGPITYVLYAIQILLNIGLIVVFYKLIKNSKTISSSLSWQWSLLFQLFALMGQILLIGMFASKMVSQHAYLAATYWYLHFCYNGWFLFACLGLWQHYLVIGLNQTPIPQKYIQWMAWSCLPAYGLSILWINLPWYVYILIALSALVQTYAWLNIVLYHFQQPLIARLKQNRFLFYLLMLVAMALSLKFLLQLGSVIPAVSKLAFGFRPIVIAYLHLILLGVISLFIMSYAYALSCFSFKKISKIALKVFVSGIFLNEFILAIQGIASFSYTIIPFMNEALLISAIILWLSSILLYISLSQNTDKN